VKKLKLRTLYTSGYRPKTLPQVPKPKHCPRPELLNDFIYLSKSPAVTENFYA